MADIAPTPWKIIDGFGYASKRIVSKGGRLVAEVWSGAAGRAKLEDMPAMAESNARLLCAAPAMRDALPDLSDVIRWLRAGCDPLAAADELAFYQEKIDAAKAKAEGRADG